MDYLVSEGYPAAAEKFAQETNLCAPSDVDTIRDRVRIRSAILQGHVSEAIALINEVDAEVSSHHSPSPTSKGLQPSFMHHSYHLRVLMIANSLLQSSV